MRPRHHVATCLVVVVAGCGVNKNDALKGTWEAKWECKPWVPEGQPGCQSACDTGHVNEACGHYGVYASGIAPAARVSYLERGCAGDVSPELEACSTLASMTAQGQGTTRDLPRVHALVDRVCKEGSECGCHALATLYAGPTMQDDAVFAQGAFAAWCAGSCLADDKAALCEQLTRAR